MADKSVVKTVLVPTSVEVHISVYLHVYNLMIKVFDTVGVWSEYST